MTIKTIGYKVQKIAGRNRRQKKAEKHKSKFCYMHTCQENKCVQPVSSQCILMKYGYCSVHEQCQFDSLCHLPRKHNMCFCKKHACYIWNCQRHIFCQRHMVNYEEHGTLPGGEITNKLLARNDSTNLGD